MAIFLHEGNILINADGTIATGPDCCCEGTPPVEPPCDEQSYPPTMMADFSGMIACGACVQQTVGNQRSQRLVSFPSDILNVTVNAIAGGVPGITPESYEGAAIITDPVELAVVEVHRRPDEYGETPDNICQDPFFGSWQVREATFSVQAVVECFTENIGGVDQGILRITSFNLFFDPNELVPIHDQFNPNYFWTQTDGWRQNGYIFRFTGNQAAAPSIGEFATNNTPVTTELFQCVDRSTTLGNTTSQGQYGAGGVAVLSLP